MFFESERLLQRTYDFPNDTPVKYRFSMDKIGIYGSFHNAAMPILFAWAPFLIRLGLMASSAFGAIQKTA